MEFLKFLEGIRTPLGELFFLFVTYGGEELTLFGIIGVLYWCIDRKLAYRMTFAYLLSALPVNSLKMLCRVERPWVRDPSFTAVERARASATGYSFPSGHTQNATALFGTLSWTRKKTWQKVLLFLIIPMVMFSRMYLGVHTPADVLASFFISLVLVSVLNLIADRVVLAEKHRLIIMLIIMIPAAVTFFYSLCSYRSGAITYANAADAFKGVGGGIGFALCWYLENTYINFDTRCKHIGLQFLKVGIGLAGVLVFKSGIKALFGSNFFTDAFRYFCVMLWAMLAMPLLIQKFFSVDSAEKKKEPAHADNI